MKKKPIIHCHYSSVDNDQVKLVQQTIPSYDIILFNADHSTNDIDEKGELDRLFTSMKKNSRSIDRIDSLMKQIETKREREKKKHSVRLFCRPCA